jgi:hypothetical protein
LSAHSSFRCGFRQPRKFEQDVINFFELIRVFAIAPGQPVNRTTKGFADRVPILENGIGSTGHCNHTTDRPSQASTSAQRSRKANRAARQLFELAAGIGKIAIDLPKPGPQGIARGGYCRHTTASRLPARFQLAHGGITHLPKLFQLRARFLRAIETQPDGKALIGRTAHL